MGIRYDNVIVFGPTGATGSAAAAEAGKRGAKVWLAMRTPSKPIPNLDESSGKYERIQADLSDPSSCGAAVKKSGAKAAYVYLCHGNQDGMKATITAMKDEGLEYIVLLSSFTIKKGVDVRDVPKDQLIPYWHAKVEETIEDLGLDGAMLRPGAFAYNTFTQNLKRDSEPWTAIIPNSDRVSDGIVPADIGRVGGSVLVDRPSDAKKEIIYLYGPKLMTREQQIDVMKEVSGKDIEVKTLSEQEMIQYLAKNGMPEFIANYLVVADNGKNNDAYYGGGRHEEGVANVKKYTGRDAMGFEEYTRGYLS